MSDVACTEIVYRFDFPNPPTLLELWRGVGPGAVRNICTGKDWRWVK